MSNKVVTYCLLGFALIAGQAVQASILSVKLGGVASVNTLGMGTGPGDSFGVEFMLDNSLQLQGGGSAAAPLFRDPWLWHFFLPRPVPWDWLSGFTINLTPSSMIVNAVFDDLTQDMVMGLDLGSTFITTLDFQQGVLSPNQLPSLSDFSMVTGSSLEIFDQLGTLVFAGNLNVEDVRMVPEPSTLLLFGSSISLIGFGWRRKRKACVVRT